MKYKYFLIYLTACIGIFPVNSFANLYMKMGGSMQISHGLKDEEIGSESQGVSVIKYNNKNYGSIDINFGYNITSSLSVEMLSSLSLNSIKYNKNYYKKKVADTPRVKDYSGPSTRIIEGIRRIIKISELDEQSLAYNDDTEYSIAVFMPKLVFNILSTEKFSLNLNAGAGLSSISAKRDHQYLFKKTIIQTIEYDTGETKESRLDGDSNSGRDISVKNNSKFAWSVGFGGNYHLSNSLFTYAGYNFTYYGSHEYDEQTIFKAHVISAGIGYNF